MCATAGLVLAATIGCSADGDESTSGGDLPQGCDQLVVPGADDQTALVTAIAVAADDSTICLGEGEFHGTRQLLINNPGLTLRGAGMDATIIEFSGLDDGGGANGILIKSDNVTLEDLQVKNTPGDGIRADQVDNIAFVRVKVLWEAMHSLENGAYGLYPVQSNGVLIQESVVAGARDAGIYVGQSTNIVVEDSQAYDNVAGIEIENSTDAIVRRNQAHDNTAGILVFNLPGLDVKDGKRANVYENTIENNNVPNFADPGTIVGAVPAGIGVLVLAADENEIHANTIRGNVSVGVALITYDTATSLFPSYDDPSYDIYSEGNWVHDNTYEGNATMPADIIQILTMSADPSPDIIFDGCWNEAEPNTDGALTNCVSGETANFMRADLCGQNMNMVTTELGEHACMKAPLPTE